MRTHKNTIYHRKSQPYEITSYGFYILGNKKIKANYY